MKIYVIGDVHGEFWDLYRKLEDYPTDATYIQVGDFGLYPWRTDPDGVHGGLPPFKHKIRWIDGNHEHYTDIIGLTEPTEIFDNLVYVPRGSVMTFGDRTFGFMGGGESPDIHMRTQGIDWWAEETITTEEMWRFPPDQDIDALITHVPPRSVVDILTYGDTRDDWNLSSRSVEQLWEGFGRPDLYCGHFHRSAQYLNVQVLDILEILEI